MSTQEQLHEQHLNTEESYLESALTRSVRLMADARQRWGIVPPEIKAMILDEELTPVLEVVVDQTTEAYGVVPRSFRVEGNDLIDPHGQSLTEVSERGSRWSRQEVKRGVPGAWKELQRRNTEAENIARIARMPAGTLLLEISANPIDWTIEERAGQHYTGLTMIRASVKPHDNPSEVSQFNFILPNLDTPEAILNLQDRLGIGSDGETVDTNKILAHPLEKLYDGSAIGTAREIDGLLGASLLEKSVGHSTLRMIQRAIERRREAWRFITNSEQADVHSELLAHIEWLSTRHRQFWEQEMAAIRTGFTRELKDRFLNRQISAPTVEGGILVAAASRAAQAGDVYIACGTTVTATEFSTQTATAAGRAEAVKPLLENVVGKGECGACGAKGSLYGCGLCSSCNKKWCDIYVRTGEQTAIKDLTSSRSSKSKNAKQSQQKTPKESDWQRIKREVQEKKIIRRQQRQLEIEAKRKRSQDEKLAA